MVETIKPVLPRISLILFNFLSALSSLPPNSFTHSWEWRPLANNTTFLRSSLACFKINDVITSSSIHLAHLGQRFRTKTD